MTLSLLLAVLLATFSTSARISYRVTDSSSLKLDGATNVNQFTCLSSQSFSAKELTINSSGHTATFSNAILSVRTQNLDCGGKGINQDMYHTLKYEDHPYIEIELLEAKVLYPALSDQFNNWTDIQANAAITLAGFRRQENIRLQVKKTADSLYRLKGSHTLYMTQFGIDPHTAMMGLIEVHDRISIYFDLYVDIREI